MLYDRYGRPDYNQEFTPQQQRWIELHGWEEGVGFTCSNYETYARDTGLEARTPYSNPLLRNRDFQDYLL